MLQYTLRRILLFIPTLLAIAIVAFIVIRLPPGSYLDTYIAQLASNGETVTAAQRAALEQQFGLNQPAYVQFFRWIGGVLHGDFGYSFEWRQSVASLMWGRLGMTLVVSLSALLLSWIISLPIGILSAVRQYSILDYVFTFISFLGLAIPGFMFALVLMWIAFAYLGQDVGGLFSPNYLDAPWSLAKVKDLLSHLWIPAIIIGVGQTAGTIRIVRANLLDELRKPYVVTARAKGLPEWKVVLKYPVRVALNPFVSTVGWALAGILSGEAIVSVVLNLPTTGPLLLNALLGKDMYLAGSFILMLSFLTVVGTLLSDLLLAWMDPRIRYE